MRRDPDFQFLSTDAEAMRGWMEDEYRRLTGEYIAPASPEKLLFSWAASIMTQERARQNNTMNQNIPSRAEGENLDALAELYFARNRKGAENASCTVRFYIVKPQESALLIPAGTRVTDANTTLYWETVADGWVKPGERYADLEVVCQTAGAAGNGWRPGSINAAVDIYPYYDGCENLNESGGGADEMTDDELYETMRLSMDALSTAGARGAYIYHAKQVSTEIADVAATTPTPGVVRIFALMKDGTQADGAMAEKILAACNDEEVRPFTDYVEMGQVSWEDYEIDLTYYLPPGIRQGSGQIDRDVEGAVADYIKWQEGKLGRDINPSKLIQLLMGTGVKRVDVREPQYVHLMDRDERHDPKAARHTAVRLINGGVEDE